ncbi:DUF1987 domain-containing protein [Sulfurimonas sp. SAG-AH-194-I05]|nr:DUF1987 domain-containing protein [Sulfurimonas sp. SAG-AH-194-I05]MDF1875499.1 DUF1987 domain-containing protein [Sulfurimonas sp. SAG-AH-194-I05]
MQRLEIEKTKSSPQIDFNAQTHTHLIRGESYPENTTQFYTPILEWITMYLREGYEGEINFNIELIYFNSSSSKVLLDLFDILEETNNNKIIVNWIHDEEDEAMEEYGEEFQEDIEHITFVIKTKE